MAFIMILKLTGQFFANSLRRSSSVASNKSKIEFKNSPRVASSMLSNHRVIDAWVYLDKEVVLVAKTNSCPRVYVPVAQQEYPLREGFAFHAQNTQKGNIF